jgi:hypothetical protein
MITAENESVCALGLKTLVDVVTNLGFCVIWNKAAQPSQKMTFLGVCIDCVERTIYLPDDKLAEIKLLLKSWQHKKKATKQELQRLIGKLCWCGRVVRGGRTFTRNLINLLCKVTQQHHYVRIMSAARSDIDWWIHGLPLFHGSTPFSTDVPLPSFEYATDACLSGGAAYFRQDWFYISWEEDFPEYKDAHINVLELKTVVESARRWGPSWNNLHVLVRSDNSATVAAITLSTSRSPKLLGLVKELFWLAVKFNFKLSASYLPGALNVLSDKLSRMIDLGDAYAAKNMLVGDGGCLCCKTHMSYAAYVSLQGVWRLSQSYLS